MKTSRIFAAALCASAGLSVIAFAQGGPGWTGGAPDSQGGPNQRPPGQGRLLGHNGAGQRNPAIQAAYGNDSRDSGRAPTPRAEGGPHAGPYAGGPRDWRRGDRLPIDYRSRQYVVDDYHAYGLRQPPRGYHWVGVNGDYALVGTGSSVIASVQLSSR